MRPSPPRIPLPGVRLVVVIDADGLVVSVSGANDEWLQPATRAWVGRHVADVTELSGDIGDGLTDALGGAALIRTVHLAGEQLSGWFVPVRAAEGHVTGALAILSVPAGLLGGAEQSYRQPFVDPLTSLLSRDGLIHELERSLVEADRSERPLAVLFVDIHGIDEINATLGWDAGDAVLRDLAARLEPGPDVYFIASRLGGDFIVVVKGQRGGSTWEMQECAENIRRRLEDPVAVRGHSLALSASVGVRLHLGTADTAEAMLQDALSAARAVTAAGGTPVNVFRPPSKSASFERLEVAAVMERVIAEDGILVSYIPATVLTASARMLFLAAVQFVHTSFGPVDVPSWFGSAPVGRSARHLGECVLARIAADLEDFARRTGSRPHVALALPGAWLRRFGMTEDFAAGIRMIGAPEGAVSLLIEASALVEDPELYAVTVGSLRQVVPLTIRSFGRARASLQDLEYLRPGALSVHVGDATGTSEAARATADAAVRIARRAGSTVIVEGVASAELLQAARRLGGDLAVGPFLAGAAPRMEQPPAAPLRPAISSPYEQRLTEAFGEQVRLDPALFELRSRSRNGSGGARLARLGELSDREWDVVIPLASGARVPAIAEKLFLSQHTIRNHLKAVYRKLGVAGQSDLLRVMEALRDGR